MEPTYLTYSIRVAQRPEIVFEAINQVRKWWSADLEGQTEKPGDEFTYRYKDLHYSRQRVTESIPGKKVKWQVLDSNLSFIEEQDEWNNTEILFEISEVEGETLLRFTHVGLSPDSECYEACSKGWAYFIEGSLHDLITTGKGQPNVKLDEPQAAK